jgi:TolB protein
MMSAIRFHLFRRALEVCGGVLAISGCSDSTGPNGRNTNSIRALASVPPTAVVGSEVAPSPTFIVADKHLRPLAGIRVDFAVTGGGGSIGPASAVTGPDGTVSTHWTLGGQPGVNTLSASFGSSASAQYTVTSVAGPFAALVPFKGDVQRAPAGSALPAKLQAKAIDAYGNPITAVPITFSVLSGGGSIDRGTVLSDEFGIATSGSWTLGPSAGVQRAVATSGFVDASFQADSFTCAARRNGACTDWGELAFVNEVDGQVYRIRVDGTGLQRLTTRGPNFEIASTPRWSPDGMRIAFVQNVGNYDLGWDTRIDVMNADGSNVVQLTGDALSSEPSWSPDGKQLMFTHFDATGSELWSMNIGDASTTRLVVHDGHAGEWSPDGNRIAFLRGALDYSQSNAPTAIYQIYTMNADSTGITPITNALTSYTAPRWSPDGNQIATSTCDATGCLAYTIHPDGSGVVAFGVQPGQNYEPSWSPDGTWIVLTVRDGSSTKLEYIPRGGGVPRLIVQGGSAGSWRP